MKKENLLKRLALVLALLLALPLAATAEMTIDCPKVDDPPVLDGRALDPAWKQVKPVIIRDQTVRSNILLRTVHTDERIYFLIQYPDPALNLLHKPWIWNHEKQQYETGPHREDTFVFKWNMMNSDVDLSNFSGDSYTADVWYWKANRTNPSGYADDKTQILADTPGKKSKEVASASGKVRHLTRKSDAGRPPYRDVKPAEYEKDVVNRYLPAEPEGSRADVRAKGTWSGGLRFIEFSRKLDTGHGDDVRLDPAAGVSPLFGVSIFSLYGKPITEKTSAADVAPNFYGMGRISEPLRLKFVSGK